MSRNMLGYEYNYHHPAVMKQRSFLNFSVFSFIALSLLLGGCTNYTIEPEGLTPELKTKFEAEVIKWNDLIKHPSQPAATQSSTQQTQEGQQTQQKETRPDFNFYINKAIAQERLGKLGDAIQTYEEATRVWGPSIVTYHNLGRIYDKVGEGEKAIEYYLKLVNEYSGDEYYLDIAKAYVKMGNMEKGKENYLFYEKKTGTTDGEYRQLFNIH